VFCGSVLILFCEVFHIMVSSSLISSILLIHLSLHL
jgi:hypothetical protein